MAGLYLLSIPCPGWKGTLAVSFKVKNLVFILGPTCVGKTDLALHWADQTSSGVLNSDSIQVYKDLKIGSAQPNFNKYPHIQHYLFSEISAPQVWTAGDFRKKALEILNQKLPKQNMLIVGASGFYIQALEKGMYPVKAPDKEIVNHWEDLEKKKGLDALYSLLEKKDLKASKQINSKDRYRILRALIVMESEKKTLSQIQIEFQEQKLPWSYVKIGLRISKEALLKKIKARTSFMLKEGLIEEVEGLIKRGYRNWRPLNSVGCRQSLLYLDGKIKKVHLTDEIVSATMSLAKKQKKWFKRDKHIQWIEFNTSALKVYKEIFKR